MISISRPKILLKNVIFGGVFADCEGDIVAINHKTGEKGILKLVPS